MTDIWDKSRKYQKHQLRSTIEATISSHLADGQRILVVDMGCGDKPYHSILTRYVDTYIGVDLPGNPAADFYCDQDGKTSLPDGVADVVLSTQVLEHVENPVAYLSECRRLLKPGGILILSTHGYWMYHAHPHDYWRWTSEGLRKAIEDQGFAILGVHGVLGLAATGLQLFQDGLYRKVPSLMLPAFVAFLQFLIAETDRRLSDDERARDGCVYVVAAHKLLSAGLDNGMDKSIDRGISFQQPVADTIAYEGLATVTAKDQPVICIASPLKGAYSETFIANHFKHIPGQICAIYGTGPYHDSNGRMIGGENNLGTRVWRSANRRVRGLPWQYYEWKAISKYLRDNRVQVVLAHYGHTGVRLMQPCADAGVPMLVHFHGQDAYDSSLLKEYLPDYQRLFRQVAGVIVGSQHLRTQLLALGADPHKLWLNPLGVDTTKFHGADPASVPPHFLAVGRFVDKKGPQLTLLAFERVLRAVPEARLTMIGDGPLLEACKKMAQALGTAAQVTFAGPRPPQEVAAAMRSARAFVQHSNTTSEGDSESLGIVFLEAGASGLPVVATRHDGIPEVIVDGETGFLVDECDVDMMAQHMVRLAADSSLAAEVGRAGRQRVQEHFSMERSISHLSAIIAAVVDGTA